MSSIPPRGPLVQPSPKNLETERLGRADGCPEACGNVEAPYRIEVSADGFTGHYRCTDCRHMWRTAWKEN